MHLEKNEQENLSFCLNWAVFKVAIFFPSMAHDKKVDGC